MSSRESGLVRAAIDAHMHGEGPSTLDADLIFAAPFLVALVLYIAAAVGERRGGARAWPWHRTLSWVLGVTAAAAGSVGPLAAAAHGSFTAHMGAHLLAGMVAPLFLVLAAPMTLALRAMSVVPARRLSRLLRSPLGRVLTNPLVAAPLNIGGMWAVYLTPLYELMQQVMLVHLLVMAHLLVAGYLYTASLVAVDPLPHRAGFAIRAAVLVASLAAHGVLAKLLYAYPLPGVATADVHAGAQLMFYGGDAVELVLMVLLCAQWYRAAGRQLPAASPRVERPPLPPARRAGMARGGTP